MIDIVAEIMKLQDTEYRDFQIKLTPGVPTERFIGVRVPELRKLAKKLYKLPESKEFLKQLPHKYYDEDMLHGLLISEIKDYDECISACNEFLPYVDNWAVCDIMSPKVFKKNKDKLIDEIRLWSKSDNVYECRFGLEMLMSHYLDEDFRIEYLDILTAVHSEEYYVNMMVAWFLATALAKQWNATVHIIEAKSLDKWVQNKTIQKARESFRITAEQKEYLKNFKM